MKKTILSLMTFGFLLSMSYGGTPPDKPRLPTGPSAPAPAPSPPRPNS